MKPFCQGFVKDLYAFKICGELKMGLAGEDKGESKVETVCGGSGAVVADIKSADLIKAAREDFAALKKLIYD